MAMFECNVNSNLTPTIVKMTDGLYLQKNGKQCMLLFEGCHIAPTWDIYEYLIMNNARPFATSRATVVDVTVLGMVVLTNEGKLVTANGQAYTATWGTLTFFTND